MNDLVNLGEIIQVRDRFRMPYSDNKNTISSCSLLEGNGAPPVPGKRSRVIKDDSGYSSIKNCSISSDGSNINDILEDVEPKNKNGRDVYVSCKAKYNNKNRTLMIFKRASTNHRCNEYIKRI